MRVFHGDGPAQQVEAGAKIGGHYPCVGCAAHSAMFNDLAYCFRADSLSISERQAFVTKGQAWKKGGTKPLDKLSVIELRTELQAHGVTTGKKNKTDLLQVYEKLRAGINHVPALLQGNPKADIKALHLADYEIMATEPLHDLKGHLSNIVEETLETERLVNQFNKLWMPLSLRKH